MDFLNSSFACILKKLKCPRISCRQKNRDAHRKKANLPVFKHAMLITSLAHTDDLSAYMILSGKITISSAIIKNPENSELFWDVISFNIFIVHLKYLNVFFY